MITKNLEDFKKFIPVETSFREDGFEKIIPFLENVYKNTLCKYIGKEQAEIFKEHSGGSEIIKEAIHYAKQTETNLAIYEYLPLGAIQITSGGINIVAPKDQKSAASSDIRDVQRYYKRTGLKALDNLLQVLEENEAEFPAWKSSKQYTKFKKLLVNSTQDFQEHYNIFDSRQTFLSLTNELETVEYQYLIPVLGKSVLQTLKTSEVQNDILKEVKDYVSKANVFYVVSKTLGSGLYFQESTGFQLRFDLLDYERNFGSKERLSSFINEQKKGKENEASNFLKIAKKLIQDNPDVFIGYVPKTKRISKPFINGKGIVAI